MPQQTSIVHHIWAAEMGKFWNYETIKYNIHSCFSTFFKAEVMISVCTYILVSIESTIREWSLLGAKEHEIPTERLIVTVKSPSKMRFKGWLWWYAYSGHITAKAYKLRVSKPPYLESWHGLKLNTSIRAPEQLDISPSSSVSYRLLFHCSFCNIRHFYHRWVYFMCLYQESFPWANSKH